MTKKLYPISGQLPKQFPFLKKVPSPKLKNTDRLPINAVHQKKFEKLILKQIHYSESINSLDFTGKQQQGLKKIKVLPQQEFDFNP